MKATISRQQVVNDISGKTRALGFHRKGCSWFRTLGEVTQVINLQRSRWGEQYYINLGVLIRAIDDRPFPRPSECHVIARLSSLAATGQPSDFVVDLEEEGAVQKWACILQQFDGTVASFFAANSSAAGIRRFIRYANVLVTQGASEFLKSGRGARGASGNS
jgi:hypothetical protein